MTKESYFEMCELLGTEPKESDIPIELDDFPDEVQTAFQIYHVLQDHWEGMSGTYMGKILTGIADIMELYEVDRDLRKQILELITMIDRERMAQHDAKRKQEDSLKAQQSPK